MAVDIHELTSKLGFNRARIVGHDIGLMVAYAYAAQFPQATERVVLMDAFLPGIGNWKDVWLIEQDAKDFARDVCATRLHASTLYHLTRSDRRSDARCGAACFPDAALQ